MSVTKILEWRHVLQHPSYLKWERNYRLLRIMDGFILEVETQPGLWVTDSEGNVPLRFHFFNDAETFILRSRCPKAEEIIEVKWEGHLETPYELYRFERPGRKEGDSLLIMKDGKVINAFDGMEYEAYQKYNYYGDRYHTEYIHISRDVKKYFRDFVLEREPMLNEQYRLEQQRNLQELEKEKREEEEEQKRLRAREKTQHLISLWKENTVILDIIPKINNKPWILSLPKILKGERYKVLNELLKTVWEHEDNGDMNKANKIARILEEQHRKIQVGVKHTRMRGYIFSEEYRRKPKEIKELCKEKIILRI